MRFSPHGISIGSAGGVWPRRWRQFRRHGHRLLAALLHRCDRLFRVWGARRLVREMQAWPDYRLKDIGISRAEIVSAVEGTHRPFRWQPESDGAKLDPERFGH